MSKIEKTPRTIDALCGKTSFDGSSVSIIHIYLNQANIKFNALFFFFGRNDFVGISKLLIFLPLICSLVSIVVVNMKGLCYFDQFQ